MTIHPAPWETDDAAGALQSNMLFPSLDEMCDALPELTERIYAPTLPSAEAEAQTAHGVRKRAASSGAFHRALRAREAWPRSSSPLRAHCAYAHALCVEGKLRKLENSMRTCDPAGGVETPLLLELRYDSNDNHREAR